MARGTRNIAHRGFPGAAPENTMQAFRAAVDAGAEGIELDVQLTRDGIPVVIHDEKVDRTTNGQGFVKDYFFDELRALDAGSWFGPDFSGEPIPTLTEVLEGFRADPVLFNIELKTGLVIYPGITRVVLEQIERHGLTDRVIISSFNHRTVAAVRRESPQVRTGVLYSSEIANPWVYAAKLGASALHPRHSLVTQEMIDTAHLYGILVHPWTVDDEGVMMRLVANGVDGIITNRPDRLARIVQRG